MLRPCCSPLHLRAICVLALAFLFTGCARTSSARSQVERTDFAHPLDALTSDELTLAMRLARARFEEDDALPDSLLHFPLVALIEPDKQRVQALEHGERLPRHAEVQVMHPASNRAWRVDVDLDQRSISQLELFPDGTQLAITAEEFQAADRLVRSYAPWREAVLARGIDPDRAYIDGWAVGETRLPTEIESTLSFAERTRLMRCLTFARSEAQPDHPYVRPVEGLILTLDMNARRVVQMIAGVPVPILDESGAVSHRTLRPLRTEQPEGSDIRLEGNVLHWQGWSAHLSLHPREGLVISDVRIDDGTEERLLAHRLSLSEIYVPYGLGEDGWSWRGAFDVGEYHAGVSSQHLEAGRDVPSHATFIDAVVASDYGPNAENPSGTVLLPHAIAIFERDHGVLFTRVDPSTGERESQPGRELVIVWGCWIGNYIYTFDWILKLDGSIETRVHLNGTTLNRGTDERTEPSAPKVARDSRGAFIAAPNHQHFIGFRLDLDVDGRANAVMEMDAAHLPGAGSSNAFAATMEHFEVEGHRDVSPFAARHWHVESTERRNAFGKPTSYALEPGEIAVPMIAEGTEPGPRARFAHHQFWFTAYRAEERYAAGAFPNQGHTADGLPTYTDPPESIDGRDVVIWYTAGFTHLSKPEDHPVMSDESIGFRLVPRGFFSRNRAHGAPSQ